MKLVIGGFSQGKLEYVLNRNQDKDCVVLDGKLRCDEDLRGKTVIVSRLHGWIRERLADGGCPEKEIMEFAEKYPECILICDEIGNGIVPADAFERAYRERTGRILIMLAESAKEVVRVICGIGQKIK